MVWWKNQDLKPSSPGGSAGGHILLMTSSNKNMSNNLRQGGSQVYCYSFYCCPVTHSDFGLWLTYSISVSSHSLVTYLQGS